MKSIWDHVNRSSVELDLVCDVPEYQIMVDWSSYGSGYALFCGHPIQGVLIGLNSHRDADDFSSSVGEPESVAWAVQDVKSLVQGRPVVLWTDAESVYKKLT